MKNKILPIIAALCLMLGIGAQFLPEIHIGPAPSPKPDVVERGEVWDNVKIYLKLIGDGFGMAADKTEAGEFKSMADLVKFLEASKVAAEKAGYKDLRERDNEALCEQDIATEAGKQATAAYLRQLKKEYYDAAE